MKKIITLLLFCGAYCSLMAQSEAETKTQINKIKRDLKKVYKTTAAREREETSPVCPAKPSA